MLAGWCLTHRQDGRKRIWCLECTWWMFWVRKRRDSTLAIPSWLCRGVVPFEQSCLQGVCRTCCFPSHSTSCSENKGVWTRHVQLVWFSVHIPSSWLVHVSCRQRPRRGLLISWRMHLGRTPLHQIMRTFDMFQKPPAWISTRAPSSVFAERAVIHSPLNGRSGGSVATFLQTSVRSEPVIVTNFIMTDSWEASHVADHCMVDCKLGNTDTGLRSIVCMVSIYIAWLVHPWILLSQFCTTYIRKKSYLNANFVNTFKDWSFQEGTSFVDVTLILNSELT